MNPEEKLIDYLYGEMNAFQQAAFEEELAQNPELQQELAELQASRSFLADLPDIQPPATIVSLKPKRLKWQRWAIPAGIAASLLILLELFNFQAVTTENGFAFSFGDTKEIAKENPIVAPQYVTIAEVQQLLESREKAYRADVLLRDSLWQNRMNTQENTMRQYLNQQMVAYQKQQQQDFSNFATTLRQEEFPEMANLVQNLLNEHQAETRLMFGEAWANWQATRSEDLHTIKTEFANVYQNQNETDALLLNVISTGDD